MTNITRHDSQSNAEQSRDTVASRDLSTLWNIAQVVRLLFLLVAFLTLLPGLLFGSLFLLVAPLRILMGDGTWLMVLPVAYGLFQITSLLAWLQPTGRLGQIAFGSWSAATILSSVFLIADLQREINAYDGDCGNPLFGVLLLQIVAGGTILGMSLLLIDYLCPRRPASRLRQAPDAADPHGVVPEDYCSVCRREVQVDSDHRCLSCRWPI